MACYNQWIVQVLSGKMVQIQYLYVILYGSRDRAVIDFFHLKGPNMIEYPLCEPEGQQ